MDFAMDENGDLAIKNGDFYLVTGVDATIQFLKQRLRLFLGEWFLDEAKGVPYFDEVFVKNPNPVALNSIFKTQIIETPGVRELLSFDMQINTTTRVMTLTIRVRCDEGEPVDFTLDVPVPGGN